MEKKKRIRIILIAVAVIAAIVLGGWKYGEYQYTAGHTAGYYEAYEKGKTKGYENGYADGKEKGESDGWTAGYRQGLNSAKTATSKKVELPNASSSQSEEKDYIVNAHTGKFHKPTCSSISQMNDTNKYYFTGTREQLIDWGYSPCQKCNP